MSIIMFTKRLIYCILFSIFLFPTAICAEKKEKVPKQKNDSIFRGFSAHMDIGSPLISYLVDHSIKTLEGSVDINLLHRFFPIVEVGYGQADKTMDNGAHYFGSAPFARVGINVNLLNQRSDKDKTKGVRNYAFLGLRYGMSFMNYTIDNVRITDDYWNTEEIISYHKDFAYAGWCEVVGGIRVDLVKGFTMGWSVRYKALFHPKANQNEMWYVPGYGKSGGSVFDFNYTIGYTFRTNNTK